MTGPWDKYGDVQQEASAGPWTKHATGDLPDGPWNKFTPSSNQGEVMLANAKEGLSKLGNNIERYIDAPFRAGLNAVAGSGVTPTPEKIGKFFGAAKEQFGEDTLPTTPSPDEQARGAGMPGWFGRVASPSIALPVEQVVAAPLKIGASAVRGAAEFAAPAAEALSSVNKAFQKGVLNVGEKITAGGLNAGKAMEEANTVTGLGATAKMAAPNLTVKDLMAFSAGHGFGPKEAAWATLASKATTPRTYMQIVGMAKLPEEAARSLMGAYQSASSSEMASVISNLSSQYPSEMSKVMVGLSNAENQQKSRDALSRRQSGGIQP